MKPVMHNASRRQFLQRSALLSTLPIGGSLLAAAAVGAQTANDYKALVCIDLSGGNDQSNTVVPLSNSGYASYQAARPRLALARNTLLRLNPVGYTGEEVGLHPSLAKLKPLFDSGRIALLANVGTLAYPLTKAQLQAGSVPLPLQIGSHSDQMHAWHSGVPDAPGPTGWMGRMEDLTASAFNRNSGVAMNMSLAGTNIMQAGADTIQDQLSTDGAVKMRVLDNLFGSGVAGTTAARQLMTGSRNHLFENELSVIRTRSIDTEAAVRTALSSPAGTLPSDPFPDTAIGRRLKMVARMISARGALSQRRQLFFVTPEQSYDHHDNVVGQNEFSHTALLHELADAMDAFNTVMNALGVGQNVTTFTVSEMGRTLQDNGKGSDHGWGGHHFIMGGAVAGNRIYGRFPTVALGGPEDAGNGQLLPTTAVDEYAATLATWFGVSGTDMSTVLPNISRFSNINLGFLN